MEAQLKLIKEIIDNNDIVLFMKGTKEMPQCGYSSLVAAILKKLNLDFKDVNILNDEDLRQAIKLYSDWPTIPQLYIKQEFIGGSDIAREMYENGDLLKLLQEKNLYA